MAVIVIFGCNIPTMMHTHFNGINSCNEMMWLCNKKRHSQMVDDSFIERYKTKFHICIVVSFTLWFMDGEFLFAPTDSRLEILFVSLFIINAPSCIDILTNKGNYESTYLRVCMCVCFASNRHKELLNGSHKMI